MNKVQCFIASALCIAFGLIFSFPLAMITKPIIGVIVSSALIALGGVFYLIGEYK